MFNILVTGAQGQLGTTFQDVAREKESNFNWHFVSKSILDITDFQAVETYVVKNNIDVIINTAAYTAVDKAEIQEQTAYAINFHAVHNLAKTAKRHRIKLIHFSTDYVFEGCSAVPYTEDMATSPKTVYGLSKLKGEQTIRYENPQNSLIIRTSWLYSEYGHNFLQAILKLAQDKQSLRVVYDQVGTPTYAKDLAQVIIEIIPQLNTERVETYHYANEGVCSWYDFAYEIVKARGMPCHVTPVDSGEYPTLAQRPDYSVLSKQKIKTKFDFDIPHWRDSLIKALSATTEGLL